jgi:hypothetical protein
MSKGEIPQELACYDTHRTRRHPTWFLRKEKLTLDKKTMHAEEEDDTWRSESMWAYPLRLAFFYKL